MRFAIFLDFAKVGVLIVPKQIITSFFINLLIFKGKVNKHFILAVIGVI